MTFKDLQKLVESQPDYDNPEQQSKLERLRDSHKMDMVTNGAIVSDALKYVNGKAERLKLESKSEVVRNEHEKISSFQMEEEEEEEEEEEGVF